MSDTTPHICKTVAFELTPLEATTFLFGLSRGLLALVVEAREAHVSFDKTPTVYGMRQEALDRISAACLISELQRRMNDSFHAARLITRAVHRDTAETLDEVDGTLAKGFEAIWRNSDGRTADKRNP